MLNASLEGSYLVGDKKLIIKNKNEDENKIEKNKNEDNSKDENDDIKVYYKIIYNEKFNEVLTDKFADFYHLGDNYYFVTEHKKNIEPESPYYYRTYCYDWEKDCRVNAIYDGKNISDYKYFIIKYLGNDIFYLFDGEKFEFINFKSKKSVYEHVDIELNIDKFKVYDGLIIAEIDYQNAMLITDKNYMIVSKKGNLDDVRIYTMFENKSFSNSTYPRIKMKDEKIEKIINNKIIELFNVEKGNNNFDLEYNDDKTVILSKKNKYFYTNKSKDYLNIVKYFSVNGLHSYHNTYSRYTFDLKTGEMIDARDLFKDFESAKKVIAKEIKEYILNYKGKFSDVYIDDYDELISGEKTPLDIFFTCNDDDYEIFLYNDNLDIVYKEQVLAWESRYYSVELEKLKPYFKDEVIEKLGLSF